MDGGWMKKIEKKMDGWMDKKKNIDGWLDGQIKNR